MKDSNGSVIRTNVTDDTGVVDDPRCLDHRKVGPFIAIMHYMTKSRKEFYARVCSSDYKKKYCKCDTCTAATFFDDDLTETYGNNMRDDRMVPFSAQLKTRMAKSDVGGDCDAQPFEYSMEYYKECLGISSSENKKAKKGKANIKAQKIGDKTVVQEVDERSRRPIFLLHVGPHKTGTTTIQCTLRFHPEPLREDSYEFLGKNCDYQRDPDYFYFVSSWVAFERRNHEVHFLKTSKPW